ncbi:hypothetical protein K469DRAFT_715877 [Zopfia rhizophila CBS 207.26]|uniref:Uncharacterized protein n=1 Tax=Zopfia rhizophila CBS 207.26 TaxID=1314779 RepID=A0A6A6DKZ1_9PEZI|nr:hypothetical protein K469DRAFT_715877 [Zopfia rhizophila CBS 207.26]
MPETSLYNPIEKHAQKFIEGKSLQLTTKANVFAEKVVRDVIKGTDGKVWRENLATAMWFVKILLPIRILINCFDGKRLDVLKKVRKRKARKSQERTQVSWI